MDRHGGLYVWIVVAIIVIILILLIGIILSNITFTLWFSKHNKNDQAVLDVKMLYGMVNMHYEMPSLVFENMKNGFLMKLEKRSSIRRKKETSDKTRINKRKVDIWAKDVKIMLRSTASLKQWFNRTLAHVKVHKLDWSTNISTGDAAWTAIVTGSIWAIKTTLIGWFSYRVRMKQNPRLFVVPVFKDEPQLATELSCIAQISCGYAFYAGIVLMFRVLKVEGGLKRWIRLYKQSRRRKNAY